MVIVGVLLIMAVLVDAWRRIHREKHAQVRMKLVDPGNLPSERELDISLFAELPNGGARVVERGDILKAAGFTVRKPGKSPKGKTPRKGRARATADGDDDLVAGIRISGEDAENVDWLDGLVSDDGTEHAEGSAPGPGKLPVNATPEVFMINVVARDAAGFSGDDILQILLACDLRFGDMNFFHRTEFESGRGAIQFSVANMMQPGVFDIDNMSDLSTPGLVFFMTAPGPEDLMQAFDYMLETARTVARNLGADVLDESRSVLTGQAIEHSRHKIRELERRLLAKAR